MTSTAINQLPRRKVFFCQKYKPVDFLLKALTKSKKNNEDIMLFSYPDSRKTVISICLCKEYLPEAALYSWSENL